MSEELDYRKRYKIGDLFPLVIVAKGMGALPTTPEEEEEHPCVVVEVHKHKIVVEDENGRYITLGEPPKVH